MATIAVKAPVFRGLNRFQSTTVAKKSDAVFDAHELIVLNSGEADDFAGGASAVGLCVAGEDASQPEAPSGSPNADVVSVLLLDQVLAEMNFSGVFAQADIGTDFGLGTSGGHAIVDQTDTTNTAVRVVGLVEGAVGDTTARVLVRFNPDYYL